jgi:transposase
MRCGSRRAGAAERARDRCGTGLRDGGSDPRRLRGLLRVGLAAGAHAGMWELSVLTCTNTPVSTSEPEAARVRTENAIVLCVDEKSQIQGVDRIAQVLPTQPRLVMDNYAAHKTPEVGAWLGANRRVTVHFTSTRASWMNLVEVWFSIIERRAVYRGTCRPVKELGAKIRQFIDGWSDRCPLCLDQDRRRDPQGGQPPSHIRRGALVLGNFG